MLFSACQDMEVSDIRNFWPNRRTKSCPGSCFGWRKCILHGVCAEVNSAGLTARRSAGTGKSFLIKKIIEAVLHLKCGSSRTQFRKAVGLTAPTGIAAINISGMVSYPGVFLSLSGQTIHSWAGIGRGETEQHFRSAWKVRPPDCGDNDYRRRTEKIGKELAYLSLTKCQC